MFASEKRHAEGKSIEAQISLLEIKEPVHTLIELWHKTAQVCFYSGDYEKAIDYSNYIINGKKEIRFALQSSARFIYMMAHYCLGNFCLLESPARSTQRFIEIKRKSNTEEA